AEWLYRTDDRMIRRQCWDHTIVSGEAHLRRNLIAYAAYYNSVRTHRSLHKDAPISCRVHQTGIIRSQPILGGLHHHYVRVCGFGTHRIKVTMIAHMSRPPRTGPLL